MQPPDPLDEWKSPPFEPEVRGDNIYARGACDDKGQTYIQIKAVEWLLKPNGKLPVNVKFLIEGEEETGGEHIEAYVKTKPPRLAADAAVVCDTEMFAPELPTICVGLARHRVLRAHVQGARHDLHSGVYGGAAPNPMQAIAEIICALKDRDGHILIPGFYDRVDAALAKGARGLGDACRSTSSEYTREGNGSRANWSANPACRSSNATWARPTLEVHGIRGGFTGEGAKTVIPARAVAKISTRLVADQRSGRSHRADAGRGRRPPARAASRPNSRCSTRGAPSLANPDNPFIHAAAEAMKEIFGPGDGLHPLGRLHSDRRRVRPLPGNSQRHDGLRPAGRQPARPQREVPPAELLPRHRGRRPLPGVARQVRQVIGQGSGILSGKVELDSSPMRRRLPLFLPWLWIAAAAPTTADLGAFWQTYCLKCHNNKAGAAGFKLDGAPSPALIASDPGRWTRVLGRIRESEMPPKGAPSPPVAAREKTVAWLQDILHNTACADGISPGPAPVRRLNRAEYAATVRDLLNMHINAGHALPADGAGGEGFDNAAETLFLSPIHAEKYLEAGETARSTTRPRIQGRERRSSSPSRGERRLPGPGRRARSWRPSCPALSAVP